MSISLAPRFYALTPDTATRPLTPPATSRPLGPARAVGAAGATSFAAVLDSATNRAASRPAIPQAAETGGSTDVRRLEDAAREMEGVFLNFLWKQAWNMSGSSFFPSGLAGDVYKDFLTQAFSDRMAEAGGIGLANFIRLSVGQSAQTEPRP